MQSMRTILALALLLLPVSAHAAPARAESRAPAAAGPVARAPAKAAVTRGVADPLKWVRDSYDPAQRAAFEAAGPAAETPTSEGGYSTRPEFSPRLRALFVDDEKYADGQVGRLDFNPFSGANDDDIKGAKVTAEAVDGAPGRKVVIARFRNMSVDQTITYFWERIGGRWYIDDIAGHTAGEPYGWTLSLVLKYGQAQI
jgi:hypothetical protein